MNTYYSQCRNKTDGMIKNSSATIREWGSLIRSRYDSDNLHLSRYDGEDRFDGFVRGIAGLKGSINGLQDTILGLVESIQYLREEQRDMRQENNMLRNEIETLKNQGHNSSTHVNPSTLPSTFKTPELRETTKLVQSDRSKKKLSQATSHGSLTINPSERRGDNDNDYRDCLGKPAIKMFLDIYQKYGASPPTEAFVPEDGDKAKARKTKSSATKMMSYFLASATPKEVEFLNQSKGGVMGNTKSSTQTRIGVGSKGKIFTKLDVSSLDFKTTTIEKQQVELATRLHNFICFYFRDAFMKEEITVPAQLTPQGRTFQSKMLVYNIGTYESKSKSTQRGTLDMQKHRKMIENKWKKPTSSSKS